MKTAHLTESEEAAFGESIARIFKLSRDREYKDRYQTAWGTKTALGLFRTFTRIADDIETGDLKL